MFAARALALLQASAFCLALPHANISLAARRLQTPAPAPVSGEKCDLVACTCAGVSLKSLAAKGVVMSGPDAEGYSYQISFCAEIPAASLPQGCQQYAEKPAIVKYKADNKADCIEIGSIGPCSQGACGMTGVKTATGVDISYTYTYGCENIFKLVMTPGAAKAPTAVTSNECTYQATWAGLSAGDLSGLGGVAGKIHLWAIGVYVVIFGIWPLYFAIGIFIKVKQEGEAVGLGAVPQLLFWKALPGLIADGCQFSLTEVSENSQVLVGMATSKPYDRKPKYVGGGGDSGMSDNSDPEGNKNERARRASAPANATPSKAAAKKPKRGSVPDLKAPLVSTEVEKRSSKSKKSKSSKKDTPERPKRKSSKSKSKDVDYGGAKE